MLNNALFDILFSTSLITALFMWQNDCHVGMAKTLHLEGLLPFPILMGGVLVGFNRVVSHLERKLKLDKVFGVAGEGCPDPDPNPMPTHLESNVHNNL